MTKEIILDRLWALEDSPYRDFTANLIPTVEKSRIIGVRTPAMRALAKKLVKHYPTEAMSFLEELPHYYYEENNLHGFIIEQLKDFDKAMQYTERFLPYIDNWATCDTFAPKIFLKYPEETLKHIKQWITSKETYTVRYGIGVLLSNYLDALFKEEYLTWVAKITSDEYYINMMIAWFFAESLAKQKDTTLPFLQNKILEKWTHNKAIQKAIESRRIDADFKFYLKGLKIKE